MKTLFKVISAIAIATTFIWSTNAASTITINDSNDTQKVYTTLINWLDNFADWKLVNVDYFNQFKNDFALIDSPTNTMSFDEKMLAIETLRTKYKDHVFLSPTDAVSKWVQTIVEWNFLFVSEKEAKEYDAAINETTYSYSSLPAVLEKIAVWKRNYLNVTSTWVSFNADINAFNSEFKEWNTYFIWSLRLSDVSTAMYALKMSILSLVYWRNAQSFSVSLDEPKKEDIASIKVDIPTNEIKIPEQTKTKPIPVIKDTPKPTPVIKDIPKQICEECVFNWTNEINTVWKIVKLSAKVCTVSANYAFIDNATWVKIYFYSNSKLDLKWSYRMTAKWNYTLEQVKSDKTLYKKFNVRNVKVSKVRFDL